MWIARMASDVYYVASTRVLAATVNPTSIEGDSFGKAISSPWTTGIIYMTITMFGRTMVAKAKAKSRGVCRVTDIIGASPSTEGDAARSAVEITATSLHDLRFAEINKLYMKLENGKAC